MQPCVFTKRPLCTLVNKKLTYPSNGVPPKNVS